MILKRLLGAGHGRTWVLGGSAEFREAIDAVSAFLEGVSDDRKLLILDFTMEVIRNDLKYDMLTRIFYTQERLASWGWPPFPFVCYDERGNRVEVFGSEAKKRMVNLADDCVVVLPWDRRRLRLSVETVGINGFKFDRTNHKAYYFSPLGICYVSNGRHSIAAGVGHRKGHIEAVEHDISVLFSHVYTDGGHWYSSHNGDKLGALHDFRVGILFEVARQKHELLASS